MSIRFLRTADSSSKNAVSFSSARTTNRFPSRCASTIQIVRPRNRRLRRSPNSSPRFLEIVGDYFPILHGFLDVLAPIAAVDSLWRAGRLNLERGGGRWLFAERRSNDNEW